VSQVESGTIFPGTSIFSKKSSIHSDHTMKIISESAISCICFGERSNQCGDTPGGIIVLTSTYSHPIVLITEASGTRDVLILIFSTLGVSVFLGGVFSTRVVFPQQEARSTTKDIRLIIFFIFSILRVTIFTVSYNIH
jgi:hypothetical protein